MKRIKLPQTGPKIGSRFQPELLVIEYLATRRGDLERGPMARMNPHEARIRLLQDGELAWVQGPRRKEIAVLIIDETIPDGRIALRDIAGVTLAESVTVTKPDLDTPVGERTYA